MDRWDKMTAEIAHANDKDSHAGVMAALQLVAEFGRTLDRIASALEVSRK